MQVNLSRSQFLRSSLSRPGVCTVEVLFLPVFLFLLFFFFYMYVMTLGNAAFGTSVSLYVFICLLLYASTVNCELPLQPNLPTGINKVTLTGS